MKADIMTAGFIFLIGIGMVAPMALHYLTPSYVAFFGMITIALVLATIIT